MHDTEAYGFAWVGWCCNGRGWGAAFGELALRAQRQDSVRLEEPTVVAAMPQVGEPIYENFKCQKSLVFSGSLDPAEADDWLDKIQRIFTYMGVKDCELAACATN